MCLHNFVLFVDSTKDSLSCHYNICQTDWLDKSNLISVRQFQTPAPTQIPIHGYQNTETETKHPTNHRSKLISRQLTYPVDVLAVNEKYAFKKYAS